MKKQLPRKDIVLNPVQLALITAPQKEKYLEGGRGVGKSTIMGHEMQQIAHAMPKSKNVLVGATYMDILATTLPSTKTGLALFGYYEDVHYVVGRKHPDWPTCHDAPNNWKHFIHWYTGAAWQMVSQDRSDTGRGINSYSVMGDEACKLNKADLDANVMLTNRAGRNHFPGHPLLNSSLFMSTIPLHADGRWFLNMREKAMLAPDAMFHLRGSTKFNRHNLAEDYFTRLKATLLPYIYEVEVLNIRPSLIENGFYPTLDSKRHYYTKFNYDFYDLENQNFKPSTFTCEGDADHDTDKEFIVAIDWGARINSMSVVQRHGREIRFIKNFYVKHPRIIDDLVNDFSTYYATHKRRLIRLYYDHSGNYRVANSKKTYAEQARDAFVKNGWSVVLMSARGTEAQHKDKHIVIALTLKEDNQRLPFVRLNKSNCKELIISMENAAAIDDRTSGVKKDKRTERSKSIPAEESTHLSDTFDMVVYPIVKPLLSNSNNFFDLIIK
jgi:hypothetical protein